MTKSPAKMSCAGSTGNRYKVYVACDMGKAAMDVLRQSQIMDIDVNPKGGGIAWGGEVVATNRKELLDNLLDKDGLIIWAGPNIDEEILSICQRLKVIGSGNVVVDKEAAATHGIAVVMRPYVDVERVADHAWALLLSLARRIPECDQQVKKDGRIFWSVMGLCGSDVFGRTLGIVGAGRIGAAVARRAIGFRMTVLYVDSKRNSALEAETGAQQVSLPELLERSHYISLHLPVPEIGTQPLIGEAEIAQMKPSAYLINTSRGAWLDEDALCRALAAGRLRGAALDVFTREPVPSEELLHLPNVILTPHRASTTLEAREEMSLEICRGVVETLKNWSRNKYLT